MVIQGHAFAKTDDDALPVESRMIGLPARDVGVGLVFHWFLRSLRCASADVADWVASRDG